MYLLVICYILSLSFSLSHVPRLKLFLFFLLNLLPFLTLCAQSRRVNESTRQIDYQPKFFFVVLLFRRFTIKKCRFFRNAKFRKLKWSIICVFFLLYFSLRSQILLVFLSVFFFVVVSCLSVGKGFLVFFLLMLYFKFKQSKSYSAAKRGQRGSTLVFFGGFLFCLIFIFMFATARTRVPFLPVWLF